MKTKRSLNLFALLVVFSLSFSTLFAREVPPVKQIEQAVCCNGTTLIAVSNSCVEGEGNCVENTCPSGSTKTRGMSCDNEL